MNEARHLYRAFGLVWAMPFACPELGAVAQTENPPTPDVTVRFGAMPAAESLRAPDICFELPQFPKLWIHAGRELVIERGVDIPPDLLRLVVLGTGTALILHQRGLVPLHASGIVTPQGHAVLFMGHSGAGKSTLLGGFLRRGYAMLCEDVAAVRVHSTQQAQQAQAETPQTAWVEPGVQITKLRADSAAHLDIATADLARVPLQRNKFVAPVAATLRTHTAAPLHTIYVLRTHAHPHVELQPRGDVARFNHVLDHTWQKLLVRRMGLARAHFQAAVTLANQARVVCIQRPETGFPLATMVEHIEADLAQTGILAASPAG